MYFEGQIIVYISQVFPWLSWKLKDLIKAEQKSSFQKPFWAAETKTALWPEMKFPWSPSSLADSVYSTVL